MQINLYFKQYVLFKCIREWCKKQIQEKSFFISTVHNPIFSNVLVFKSFVLSIQLTIIKIFPLFFYNKSLFLKLSSWLSRTLLSHVLCTNGQFKYEFLFFFHFEKSFVLSDHAFLSRSFTNCFLFVLSDTKCIQIILIWIVCMLFEILPT